jgi:hypothetical protein
LAARRCKNTVHRSCIASPSQHRQRSGKKKSEKDELAQKAAQVIDSAEQRILALPATWAPPTTGHPGPSMPAGDGPDALPGREPHTRERSRATETARPLSVALPTVTTRAPRVRRAHGNVSMTCGPGIPWGPRRNYGKTTRTHGPLCSSSVHHNQ